MILTGPAIKAAVKAGDIRIDPFDVACLNPNSYNYHLAENLLVPAQRTGQWKTVSISRHGYVLQPKRVYLGATLESIGSNRFVTLLLGRSSVGRLGIFLNVTADLGHLGSCSNWTLEITVVQPVRVYPGIKIGQVSFWLTDENSAHHYKGRYHRDTHPVKNRDRRLKVKTK